MKLTSLLYSLGLFTVAFTAQPLLASPTKPAQPERIAFGQEVDLAQYLVPGKTVIFDFTSEYCPPCRAISPHLDQLHADRADIVVVKVDLNREGHKGIDWQSPVARQYHMRRIPHFKIFGPDGKLVAEGNPAREMVTAWFK